VAVARVARTADRVNEVPPLLQAWIAQLLDPQVQSVIAIAEQGQVDIRLSASRGRVRSNPVITINGGPSEMQAY
jgi:hypothetical protein